VSTITLIHETHIDAPADTAWRVVADYTRDVEWREGVLRMVPTPTGPLQVGTTTEEDMKVAGRTYRNHGEVITVTPGSDSNGAPQPAQWPTAHDTSHRSTPGAATSGSSCTSNRLASTDSSHRC
jgi:hypothetical protein